MSRLFTKFRKNEAGATAVEYALICEFISLLIVVSVATIGSSLNVIFVSVQAGF